MPVVFFNKEGVIFQEIEKQKSKGHMLGSKLGEKIGREQRPSYVPSKGNKGTFQLNI